MNTLVRRLGATLAAGALAVTAGSVVAGAPAQAAAVAVTPESTSAANWLIGNLDQGLLSTASEWEGETFSGPSYGTTIDLALGLASFGTRYDATEATITDAIAENLAAYTTYQDAVYSGSSAKALALAVAQGRDATTFGGVNLQARVEGLVAAAAPITGRLQDADPTPDEYWDDYANTIGQAFAARALSELDSAQAPAVLDYLLAQQCDAGFFRTYFPAAGASDQSCDGASPAEPAAQGSDTTALVVLQLAAVSEPTPQVEAAVSDATDWLVAQQRADGSFADPLNGVNTNTTGLAGWALAEAGRDEAAAKAASWIRGRQVVGACEPALARETGAIAYDDNALAAGRTYGIADPLDRSQWLIAGVQAAPVLAYAPQSVTAPKVTGPAFAQAGKPVRVTVSGLAPGAPACLAAGTATTKIVGKSGSIALAASTTKATRTLTLRSLRGDVSATTQVLGAKTLKPKVKKVLKRGSKQRIKVTGLAKGEKLTVKIGAKKVAAGKANGKGVYSASFKVKIKKGKTKLKVTGQFAVRTGSKKVIIK